MEMLANIAGLIGVVCFLTAFFLLQNGRWNHHQPPYLLCNLAGALLVLASLWVEWNFPAFLLELLWAFISMWGLIKFYRSR